VNRRAGTASLSLAVAALLGLAIGAGAMLVTQRAPAPPAGVDAPATGGPPARAVPAPSGRVLLVWGPRQLPTGLAARLHAVSGIGSVTRVRGDLVGLVESTGAERRLVDRPRKGMVIPLDTIAFDRATYPAFLPASARAAFRHLGRREVLLGATSARLRRLGPGGRLLVGSRWLTVAGVVDDSLVGGAELALTSAGGAAVGVHTDRYLLVAYRTERAKVEAAIRQRLPAGLAVRFRGPGETPFFRNGDAVLPQALVKERFGEFAYEPGPGRAFTEDPAWEAANIVTARMPILGRVRCHRTLMRALRDALNELEQRNLAGLVDPTAFGGCWNPRMIRLGGGISRHAWGAAVDLNTRGNPTGLESAQDPRLVEVMRRWGFTWGGHWLIPDPSHFEYLQAPTG
jgi:D-alanyl-D-alanine carboxypeptidase